jgi:hypothetical protein
MNAPFDEFSICSTLPLRYRYTAPLQAAFLMID